jgi:hypothetical protein
MEAGQGVPIAEKLYLERAEINPRDDF